jgi:hypothetical protein
VHAFMHSSPAFALSMQAASHALPVAPHADVQ